MKKSLYVLFAFFILVSIKTASLAEITPYGDEISVGRDTSSGDPRAAMAKDGSFVVVWLQVDKKNPWGGVERSRILATLYNPDGTEKSGEFDISVKSGNNRAHSVAMAPDGSFTVVWARGAEAYHSLFVRRFFADGTAKDAVGIPVLSKIYRGGAELGMAKDGSFVVMVTSPHDHRFQYKIYNSDGTVRRGLSTFAPYSTQAPRLAMSPDGSFLLTWSQIGGLISAKRFSPSGEQLGSKITFTTDIYHYPRASAAVAPDGGFVITWAGAKSYDPTVNTDVYARRYDAQGAPIGTEFQVNTHTKGGQFAQSIAMAGDGTFVITWTDNAIAPGHQQGRYAQQYSSKGVAYGPPSLIMARSSGYWPIGVVFSKRIADNGSFVMTLRRNYGSRIYELLAQLFRLDCQNPVADAGTDETYEQTSPDGAYVDFDGLASTGTDLNYDWSWDGNTASGAEQSVMLPPGENIVTLTVTNGNCSASDFDTVLKTVEDTIAPSTNVITSGTKGSDNWYISDVVVSFIASDSGSGVREIHYQVNSGLEQTVPGSSAATTLTTDRYEHTILYGAVDNASNIEGPKRELTLNIDKSAPLITITSPVAKEYTVAEGLEVGFSASDATSGVASASITATLDGQAVVNGQAVKLLDLYATNGENHTFTVSARDVAGNAIEKVVQFKSIVTADAIIDIINSYLASGDIKNKGIATSLIKQISNGGINDFLNHVTAQEGKGISLDAAAILIKLAGSL